MNNNATFPKPYKNHVLKTERFQLKLDFFSIYI